MKNTKIVEFCEVLRSKAPVPGGGGAAALVGAVGVALAQMVGSLTVGKKKYAPVEDRVLELMKCAEQIGDRLLELIEEDAKVFEPLAKAYGLPSATDAEKEEKAKVMEQVLFEACKPPIEMMRCLAEAIEIAREIGKIGSVLAVSDAGCAAVLCGAAMQAASLNVFINTGSMKNRERANELNAVANKLLAENAGQEVFAGVLSGLYNEETRILKGADVIADMRERIEKSESTAKSTLAILRVGDKPDDIAYENSAVKRCEGLGINVKKFTYAEDCDIADVLAGIDIINKEENITGALLLRPFPKNLNDEVICSALDPKKDADGVTPGSLAGVFTGRKVGFAPCTATACMEMLDYYGIELAGKHVVVVGRSLVIGKPVAMLLEQRNATVTICHSRTKNLPAVCRSADIIIAAVGRAHFIGKDHVKAGQVVIDVGINFTNEGKLVGDVDFEAVNGIVCAVTPVPGGVGGVTTMVLARNTLADK